MTNYIRSQDHPILDTLDCEAYIDPVNTKLFILYLSRALSFYFCLAALIVYFWQPVFGSTHQIRHLGWYDLYFLAFLQTSTVILWFATGELESTFKVEQRPSERLPFYIGISLITFASFFVYLLKIHDFGLWLDELTQAQLSRSLTPVLAAAHQHQPPLDYLLSGFAQSVLGVSEFSLRFHAVMFGSLALSIFYTICFDVTKSLSLSLALASSFGCVPFIFRYATEARPISCAICMLLLLLFFVFEFLKNLNRKYLVYCFPIFAGCLLLLLSVGLQPSFLLAAIVVLAILASFYKPCRKGLFALCICMGLSLILFLPLQFEIIHIASSHFFQDILSRIPVQLDWIGLKSLAFGFEKLGLSGSFLIACFALQLLLTLAKHAIKNTRQFSSCVVLSFASIGLIFLFYLMLIPFFTAYINWPLEGRYFSLALPLAYIGIIFSLQAAVETIHQWYGGRKFWPVGFCAATLILLGLINALQSYQINEENLGHEDLRGFYKFLEKTGNASDLLIALSTTRYNWFPDRLYGIDLYYHPSPTRSIQSVGLPENNLSQMAWLFEKYQSNDPLHRILVLYERAWSTVEIPDEVLTAASDAPIIHFNKLSVATLLDFRTGWQARWFRFIEDVSKSGALSHSSSIIELKMQQALLKVDASAFLKLRSEMVDSSPGICDSSRLAAYRDQAEKLRIAPLGRCNL